MTTPIRVLHFAENFLPQLGGAELSMHEMTQAQRSLGADARILMASLKARREMAFPYPTHQFPKSRLYSNRTWAFAALSSLYLRWRFNVIHFQVAIPHARWTLDWRSAFNLQQRVKMVVTTAGSDLNVIPEIDYGDLMDSANLPRALRVLSEADALVPTSRIMVDRIKELAPQVASKITVIPRGCSIDKLQNARQRRLQARQRFGLGETDFVVLSAGRPAKVKNLPLLLRVIASAARSIPSIRLLCVGDMNSELVAMAKELKLDDRIRFTGRFPPAGSDPNELLHLPHEGMIDAIAAADVGVLTSYVESYNRAAAEQAAAGVPLIVTHRHGIQDQIPDSYKPTFVLSSLDEAAYVDRLLQLHSNKPLYDAYSQALQSSCASLTHQNIAKAYLDVYRALIEHSQPRQRN